MAAPGDLTTLPVVQAWLSDGGKAPTDENGVLARLITSCSGSVLAYLQRQTMISQAVTDVFGGRGNRLRFLEQWPVTSITSVTVDNRSVDESDNGTSGWYLQPWSGQPPGNLQSIQMLGGGAWPKGLSNCRVSYVAGYLVSAEPMIAASDVQVTGPYGPWAADGGVVNASTGVALTKVSTAPATGQYALRPFPAAPGTYWFADADEGLAVLTSYSFVPATIEQATCSLIAERYKMRGRIGLATQNMGGQVSESYDRKAIPDYIRIDLDPYRKLVPVGGS